MRIQLLHPVRGMISCLQAPGPQLSLGPLCPGPAAERPQVG